MSESIMPALTHRELTWHLFNILNAFLGEYPALNELSDRWALRGGTALGLTSVLFYAGRDGLVAANHQERFHLTQAGRDWLVEHPGGK